MKYSAIILCAMLFAVLALPARAAPLSEIHITPDGKFVAKNVMVMQKSESGATFFGRVIWGSVFLRVTVLMKPDGVAAKITKNNGGTATYAEVNIGDTLSVEGTLAPGADTLLINATSIRDHSLNVEGKTLSGTVKSVNYSTNSFVLPNKTFGNTIVAVNSNTTITKGVRDIGLGEMAAGNKVLSATGPYDYTTNTLSASSVEVYQDKNMFVPQNYQGKLKSLSGATLPATAIITVGAKDYTVYLPTGASILSSNKSPTSLQRYTAGDSVRFYGAIRQTNLTEVDADVLRNLAF